MRQWLTHNLWLKLVSVVISVIIWMIVIGSKKIEVTKDIPIQILKAPDVVIANEIPEKVLLKLSGPQAFLRGLLDRTEPPLKINLTGVRPPALVTHRLQAESIRLPLGVEVQAVQPSAILIKLEQAVDKEVRVRLDLTGGPREGFQLVRSEVTPSTVIIRGAEARIGKVDEVATLPIDLSRIRGSYRGPVDLDLGTLGSALVGERPRVLIDVRPLTPNSRLRNVPVSLVQSPSAPTRVDIQDATVVLLVRSENPDAPIAAESIKVEVEVEGLGPGNYRLSPQVTLPKDVYLVRTIPEQIHVQIH